MEEPDARQGESQFMTDTKRFAARIENIDAASPIVLVCEHASNAFPAPWEGGLGLSADQRRAHVAWDPGALELSHGLARRLSATLVHAPVSRLVYDLNRPPHSPGAMPERSEIHDIPGNAALGPEERAMRTARVYDAFHADLAAHLSARLSRGQLPVVITIHSFTPIYHGVLREVEFGIIHDDTRPGDEALARAILHEAEARTRLVSRLNEPYSAADGVTHLLRRQAVPYGLSHAMLELRNDLIATQDAAEAMAETLAPVLDAAVAAIRAGEGG